MHSIFFVKTSVLDAISKELRWKETKQRLDASLEKTAHKGETGQPPGNAEYCLQQLQRLTEETKKYVFCCTASLVRTITDEVSLGQLTSVFLE